MHFIQTFRFCTDVREIFVPSDHVTFRHVNKAKLCDSTMFVPASTSRVLGRSGPMASLGPLKFTFCSHPEGVQTLRSKLDLKVPSSTIEQHTTSASPSLSLLSSMEVMAPPPLKGKSVGLIERAREAGLAYYEWSFFYDRLLPPELAYLTQASWCGLCHTPLSSLEEARHHYLSVEHQIAAESFLESFFVASPRLRPRRQKKMDHRVWEQMYDRPLPSQLVSLCNEDECRLCDVSFSDPVERVRHYRRSEHGVNVGHFLHRHFFRTPSLKPLRNRRTYWFLQWHGRRLPREILVQCTPTFCHLCNQHLADHDSAEEHYVSEKHAIVIDLLLEQFYSGSVAGPPKRVLQDEVHRWQRRFKNLPEELLMKCQETKCDLCNVELPNLGLAKSHYEGKHHLSLVRRYLQYFQESGLALRNKDLAKPFVFEI